MKIKLIVLLLFISILSPVYAGTFAEQVGDLTAPTIGIAAILPACGGSDGLATAARRVDGVLVALALTDLLKNTIHEARPDRSDNESFPSGHTAAAFAIASVLSEEHPKQKWFFLGLAALVGWSRVESDKHHWRDVLAGAAIGFTCGRWSVESDRGILIGRIYRW